MCVTKDRRILEPAAGSAPVECMGAMTKDYANGFRGRPSWLANNNNTFHYSAWQVHGRSDFSSATPASTSEGLPRASWSDHIIHPSSNSFVTLSLLTIRLLYLQSIRYMWRKIDSRWKIISRHNMWVCEGGESVYILRSGGWIVKSVCLLLCYFANRDDNRAPVMTIASSHSSSCSVPDPNHHHHHYRQSLAQSHHTPVTYDGIVILLLLVTCRPSKWNCSTHCELWVLVIRDARQDNISICKFPSHSILANRLYSLVGFAPGRFRVNLATSFSQVKEWPWMG